MDADLFFRGRCSRCQEMMTARAISYFTEHMICLGCLEAEIELKARLRHFGIDPHRFEGCGHWPSLTEAQRSWPISA